MPEYDKEWQVGADDNDIVKAAFFTLGCRLNQYESDSLITIFKNSGYQIVDFKESADVYVINTCTVTTKSDYKSRNAINRAAKNNPAAFIVVTGCYAETDPELLAKIHGVDLVISNEKKHGIVELANARFTGKNSPEIINDSFRFPAPVSGLHTRSYLKIQDGCDNFCSYCKVPFARGNPKSRNFEDTISTFKCLVESGMREIILTGINVGKFDGGLPVLIKELVKIKGDFRIHLSSIEMNFITDELVALFQTGKLCHHLHIPLQSGSDRILRLMNRNYSAKDFVSLTGKLKDALSGINLTTDVITGFPGETEEDFQETVEIIKQSGFSHIHTFRYSPRAGTDAVKMKNTVPANISTERSEIIRSLSEKQKLEYIRQFINSPMRLLVEKNFKKDGNTMSSGKTDNYIDMVINGNLKQGQFYNVQLEYLENHQAAGRIINAGDKR